ncbi:MAG: hypothetical protein GXO42_02715 [bacterium]|nr:hypothetical protein [bacterium]
MSWFIIILLLLILLIIFHVTNYGNFIFVLLLLAVAFSLYRTGGKKKKSPSEYLDFFTHKDTSPLEPYFDLISEEKLKENLDRILSSANIPDDEKARIIMQVLNNYLQTKASLFINNPTAAITLAAYYKVYKKLQELEQKSPEQIVYWCPACFRLYTFKSQDEASKYAQRNGGMFCEHCKTKLVQIKAPFTFSFMSLLSAPFDTALEALINAAGAKKQP